MFGVGLVTSCLCNLKGVDLNNVFCVGLDLNVVFCVGLAAACCVFVVFLFLVGGLVW